LFQIIKNLQQPISISGISSVSALGSTSNEVWNSYLQGTPLFNKVRLNRSELWVSQVPSDIEQDIIKLQEENTAYRKLDRSVLLALLASRGVFNDRAKEKCMGINIGSSRGATQLFENYHAEFLKSGSVSAFTSPTTTLGNISSWVAQDLGIDGFVSGHSVTCSTALHAVLNGIAWLRSGMADVFIAGGSEAALTHFTVAQMQALKLCSTSGNVMACESMRFQKKQNTMVLGEGAGIAVLERGNESSAQAFITGYGFAAEKLAHNSSITENADCFQRSMKMALQIAGLDTVDAIVMHAPGTVKGDLAEKNAADEVFGDKMPLLTSNKWMIGHTFGASGMMSLQMGVLMLQHNKFIENPFFENARHLPETLRTIMINAVGFGGNAVSIIISKP
jgi:3-oxoacyl-(acyl-carrier-protein) synthase